MVSFVNFARIASICGFSSWYIAWLLFLLRHLAKFEFPARIPNKTCLNICFNLSAQMFMVKTVSHLSPSLSDSSIFQM